MTKDEALKMAIEAMQTCDLETETWSVVDIALAIHACKEALEQPAQKPEYVYINPVTKDAYYLTKVDNTHPHQWVGLSSNEILDIYFQANISPQPSKDVIDFIRAIEQELKTKNGFSDIKEKNYG